MIPTIIQKALDANPDGIRCFVAKPPTGHKTDFTRGTTGYLQKSRYRQYVAFHKDGGCTLHFKWKEWQGLHIPSLHIIQS